MTTVGTLVAASSALLYFGIPQVVLGSESTSFASDAGAVGIFVSLYAFVHLIADVFGAVVIPRAYNRMNAPIAAVLTRLGRGVLTHSFILWVIGTGLLAAGHMLGLVGVILASAGIVSLLLMARPILAHIIERDEGVWRYRPRKHKTEHRGRERVVLLGPRAQAVIAPFLEGRDVEAFLFSSAEAERRARGPKGEAEMGQPTGDEQEGQPQT